MRVALVFFALSATTSFAQEAPLRVFATTTDLGSLAREVGGDQVSVFVVAKGREDAHFLEAKPGYIKELNQADVYLQNGLELEAGYASLLLQNARNAAVLPGNPGYVDASVAIVPQEVPTSPVDRSMGDIHPLGNPHYLLDPVNGLRVAHLLAERFAQLRPQQAAEFRQRYDDFKRRLGTKLVGEKLAAKYDAEKLAALQDYGKLDGFLQQQGDGDALGGWIRALAPYRGSKYVDDHNIWAYFARRFSLVNEGHLEPKPGLPPTTRHLQDLIERMRLDRVSLILASPYYDPRHARFVAEATGAKVVYLAHQVGGRDGTDDYLSMIDYDVRQIVEALRDSGESDR
jgi:ABC-type Zn uptake system ZnuABC Zn-binding protein ZnuA